jgi:hypothetical protein
MPPPNNACSRQVGTRRVFTCASRKSIGTMCGKAVSPRQAHGPNGVQAGSFRGFEFFRFDGVSTLPPTAANASR